MRRLLGLALFLLLVAAAPARAENRYQLVRGCYSLQGQNGTLGPYRMQATALGRYMLYAKDRTFLGNDGATVTEPGPAADHAVTGSGDTFTVEGVGTFKFIPATGCPEYPEAEVNATGPVRKGPAAWGETKGYVDAHMHMMGFEFLGGNVHCGRPWSPYGVTVALKGCENTEVGSPVVEAVLTQGDPAFDQRGWPTFNDWPEYNRLTHEQSYYKWLERSWRGGQRLFVNLFVENHALCSLYPSRRNSCNEMDSVRLQAKDLRLLEDYIDAQNGGPGKGWFRIVSDPFQARRVINRGKLAVVPGIEVSNLFDCGLVNDQSPCTRKDVDARLNEVYNKLGVRDMELINKFDNGFGGVAGDGGSTGIVVNNGNKYETGRYWDMGTCNGPAEQSDKEQMTLPDSAGRDEIFTLFSSAIPGGTLPVYGAPPHCNRKGLTPLGEYLVRRMADKRMLIDPDHLSVVARKQLLTVTESRRYSGLVSSHSWSTSDAYPRIYRSGGFVAPYAGSSMGFVGAWKRLRKQRSKKFYWGIGWGADMNGFGGQGGPRGGENPVQYPFKTLDGKVSFDRQQTGERSFDINKDGVAHYGEYPDWVEDLRMQAGNRIVRDLQRGSEAYLQMWERAIGVAPSNRCRQRNLGFRASGVGLLRLGARAEEVLRGAGQPIVRTASRWVWCVQGRKPNGRVVGGFDKRGRLTYVSSTGRHHRINGVGRGERLPAKARRVKKGLYRRGRFVYGARKGRVRFVAVVRRGVSPRAVRP